MAKAWQQLRETWSYLCHMLSSYEDIIMLWSIAIDAGKGQRYFMTLIIVL